MLDLQTLREIEKEGKTKKGKDRNTERWVGKKQQDKKDKSKRVKQEEADEDI